MEPPPPTTGLPLRRTPAQRAALHAINPLVRPLLRSRLHPLLSRSVLLLTYTGRRSGRRFTIPVQYTTDGDVLVVAAGAPERKVWWRNLTGEGAEVRVRLRGRDLGGRAVARVEDGAVRVRITLA